MNRRSFLISATAGIGVLIGGGIAWLNVPATDAQLTMDAVIEQLNAFRGKALVTSGKWSPAHVFNHNALNANATDCESRCCHPSNSAGA